jgi:hypothetical protein
MRVDLVVNPFRPTETSSEPNAWQSGAAESGDPFLALMRQISAALENSTAETTTPSGAAGIESCNPAELLQPAIPSATETEELDSAASEAGGEGVPLTPESFPVPSVPVAGEEPTGTADAAIGTFALAPVPECIVRSDADESPKPDVEPAVIDTTPSPEQTPAPLMTGVPGIQAPNHVAADGEIGGHEPVRSSRKRDVSAGAARSESVPDMFPRTPFGAVKAFVLNNSVAQPLQFEVPGDAPEAGAGAAAHAEPGYPDPTEPAALEAHTNIEAPRAAFIESVPGAVRTSVPSRASLEIPDTGTEPNGAAATTAADTPHSVPGKVGESERRVRRPSDSEGEVGAARDAHVRDLTWDRGGKPKTAQVHPGGAEAPEEIAASVEHSTSGGRPVFRNQQSAHETRAVEPRSQETLRVDSMSPAAGAIENTKIISSQRPAETAPVARPREFVFQLADHIVKELQDGTNGVRIQLKPAALGRLEINAEHGAAGVVARIVTESGAVRQFLEGNLQMLEQAIQDQGLKLDRIDVVVNQNLDHRQSGNQGDANSGQGNHAGGNGRHTSADPEPRRGEITADAVMIMSLGPNSTFHTVA